MRHEVYQAQCLTLARSSSDIGYNYSRFCREALRYHDHTPEEKLLHRSSASGDFRNFTLMGGLQDNWIDFVKTHTYGIRGGGGVATRLVGLCHRSDS